MKCKAECYTPSKCRLRPARPQIPFHGRTCLVAACGRLCLHRKKINISTVLAGRRLKTKKVGDGIWLVSCRTSDLGYIDLEQEDLATPRQPVRPEVVTHVLGHSVTYVSGLDTQLSGSGGGTRTPDTRIMRPLLYP